MARPRPSSGDVWRGPALAAGAGRPLPLSRRSRGAVGASCLGREELFIGASRIRINDGKAALPVWVPRADVGLLSPGEGRSAAHGCAAARALPESPPPAPARACAVPGKAAPVLSACPSRCSTLNPPILGFAGSWQQRCLARGQGRPHASRGGRGQAEEGTGEAVGRLRMVDRGGRGQAEEETGAELASRRLLQAVP